VFSFLRVVLRDLSKLTPLISQTQGKHDLFDPFPLVFYPGRCPQQNDFSPLDQGFFDVKVQLMFLLVHLRHLTLSLASHFTLRCAHGMQALYTR
jgi:hypothetical protein